jgi:DNA polymerase gamma 1
LRLCPSSGASSDALDWEVDDSNGNGVAKRWEDLTSANSLVDVARLHCKIDLEEEKLATRNRLMRLTRGELLPHLFPSSSSPMTTSSTLPISAADQGGRESISEDFNSDEEDALSSETTLMTETAEPPLTLADLLTYCSTDVLITHSVFQVVLPSFLKRCPHPVSFAGALAMGSSFLPVNENWEKYIGNAERVYRSMEESVRRRLRELAEEAKDLAKTGVSDGGNEPVWDEAGLRKWERDPWLSQLDWTPKKVGKSRGVVRIMRFLQGWSMLI